LVFFFDFFDFKLVAPRLVVEIEGMGGGCSASLGDGEREKEKERSLEELEECF
jgi:hypothetical protein